MNHLLHGVEHLLAKVICTNHQLVNAHYIINHKHLRPYHVRHRHEDTRGVHTTDRISPPRGALVPNSTAQHYGNQAPTDTEISLSIPLVEGFGRELTYIWYITSCLSSLSLKCLFYCFNVVLYLRSNEGYGVVILFQPAQ